jgi:putative oxidoreductase
MKFIVLTGRVLFSLIFVMSGFSHFNQQIIQYAGHHGIVIPGLLVPLSGIIAIIGGLSILFGFKAKWGAWLIVLFLIPVTLSMHNFWSITDPEEHQMQMIMFMKNISMLGGTFIISYFGAGPISIDSRRNDPAAK